MNTKKIFALTLVIALMAFAIVGCASDEKPAPTVPPIDETPGETPNEGQPGGEQPGGEQPGGEQPGGEQPGGEQPGANGGQTPGNGDQAAEGTASAIPHATDGIYENCMQCHSEITASHEAFGDFQNNCSNCHQPAVQ